MERVPVVVLHDQPGLGQRVAARAQVATGLPGTRRRVLPLGEFALGAPQIRGGDGQRLLVELWLELRRVELELGFLPPSRRAELDEQPLQLLAQKPRSPCRVCTVFASNTRTMFGCPRADSRRASFSIACVSSSEATFLNSFIACRPRCLCRTR